MDIELIDIYDSEMNLLGVASKEQAHQEGLWHKVAMCWIISEDGNLWLQQRSSQKQRRPNCLDTSCAGHIQVAEAPKDAALRMLHDDLGLKLKAHNLTKLFTHKIVYDEGVFHNREFCPTYLLKTQAKLTDLKLDETQVTAVFEADIQDLMDLFFGDIASIEVKGIKLTKTGYKTEKKKIKKEDFFPHSDKYYQKLFSTVQRFIDNQ